MESTLFHLSLPCKDVQESLRFYEKKLGLKIGRKSYYWFDVDVYGHQVTFTKGDKSEIIVERYSFEGQSLPMFHFGVILDQVQWETLYKKFCDLDFFAIGSNRFLEDRVGNHKSFFIVDPNGYFIEFKNFTNKDEVFRSEDK